MRNADPKFSAGARYERKAFRAYLRRKLAVAEPAILLRPLLDALQWVLVRQKRYDKKAGGL